MKRISSIRINWMGTIVTYGIFSFFMVSLPIASNAAR